MQEKLQEFAASMSSISQIYFHILNSEMRRRKLLPFWKKLFYRNTSKKMIFMQALAKVSDLDIAQITKDALGYSLPQFQQPLPVKHRPFCQKDDGTDMKQSIHSPESSAYSTHQTPNVKVEEHQRKHLQLHTVTAASESLIELQEVIIHGADTQDGFPQHKGNHQRMFSSGSVDSNSKATSTTSSIVPKSAKTIGGLAPQRRGNSGAKSLVAAIKMPVEAVGDGLRMTDQNFPQVHSIAKKTLPSSHPLALCSDDAVVHMKVPQSPPRSRSSSRPRQAVGYNPTAAVASSVHIDPQSSCFSAASVQLSPDFPVVNQMPLPRSRSHSRNRAGEETSRTATNSSFRAAPTELQNSQVQASAERTPLSSERGIAASATQHVALTHDKKSYASSGPSLKRHSSKPQNMRDEPPDISWERKTQMIKDRLGVCFEEC
jgi:hypothetical protein